MNQAQLIDLLDDGKATNSEANDFYIIIPRTEMSSALMSLTYLKGAGTITGFDRRSQPDDDHIDITGYTG